MENKSIYTLFAGATWYDKIEYRIPQYGMSMDLEDTLSCKCVFDNSQLNIFYPIAHKGECVNFVATSCWEDAFIESLCATVSKGLHNNIKWNDNLSKNVLIVLNSLIHSSDIVCDSELCGDAKIIQIHEDLHDLANVLNRVEQTVRENDVQLVIFRNIEEQCEDILQTARALEDFASKLNVTVLPFWMIENFMSKDIYEGHQKIIDFFAMHGQNTCYIKTYYLGEIDKTISIFEFGGRLQPMYQFYSFSDDDKMCIDKDLNEKLKYRTWGHLMLNEDNFDEVKEYDERHPLASRAKYRLYGMTKGQFKIKTCIDWLSKGAKLGVFNQIKRGTRSRYWSNKDFDNLLKPYEH